MFSIQYDVIGDMTHEFSKLAIFGPKIYYFQHILNLVHEISMKLWGNIIRMKRKKTDQFGYMFAHSSPGILIILGTNLGHFWSQSIPFATYLHFGSSDFHETLRKCSSYKENEDRVWSHVRPSLPGHACASSFSLYQEHFLKDSSKVYFGTKYGLIWA